MEPGLGTGGEGGFSGDRGSDWDEGKVLETTVVTAAQCERT